MSETNSQTDQTQSKQSNDELASELNRLGENLGKVLKSPWTSEERKSIERELKSGMDQFTKQINKAVEQTRVDHNVKKARQTVKDAWETAHGPQVLNEMRHGLVDSLRKLNDEIAKRAEPKPAQEVTPNEPPSSAADSAAPVEEVKP
jgi:ElaB/YqjD/DUF883 family membrane-anchored ribosome-binding protein